MDATGDPNSDLLSTYRAKRSPGVTPEPVGAVGPGEGRLFVVHKHAATRLHWDLRLQMEGVLRSWAVPKGPSADPAEKRLAVHVEDHPLEYGDFEGLIPEGNYGAGAVIVWDRGEWIPLEDPVEGLKRGKLLFELRGYKLRGRWTLVKIKKGQKEWLLIKERDQFVRTGSEDVFPDTSVLSGLTVQELGAGQDRAGAVRQRLEALNARRARLRPEDVELMLAETREQAFSKPGWVFEIKYDGYRMLAAGGPEARLISRNGNDLTAGFPELERALRALPYDGVLFDGEAVVHDQSGLPSFQRLQKRARLSRPADVRRAAVELPAAFYVFDLLGFEDYDLRKLPLVERKALARQLVPDVGPLKFADHVEEQGEAFYDHAVKLGLEGMVAKKADAAYQGGRSSHWIKVRADRTDDFVVVGYTAPKGSRDAFGALHLAAYDGDELVYVGRAGSGFKTEELAEVRRMLDETRRDTPPCRGAPAGSDHTWTEPKYVAEVRYREMTDEGLLRQPVFLRFRDDKPITDCVKRSGEWGVVLSESGTGAVKANRPSARTTPHSPLQLTNLDKVFWREEGYTKGDLVSYYRDIAPWMLPYLQDRPLVMTRFPDGIDGKQFFQKDAPGFAPDWVRTEVMYSEDADREVRYFVADQADALVYIANLGTIPIHVWASRVATIEQPDWSIIDLDPGEAPFAHVVEIALAARALCQEIELPSYIKTSGGSGLHVLLPMGRQVTHDQARQIAELLARVLVAELPEIATVKRLPQQREGKVYLDYLQNGRGKLLVAPFCVRPFPGAPVSTPLTWNEVTPALDPQAFTIKTIFARLKRRKADSLLGVLDERPDLTHALGKLNERPGRKRP
jgi:bifunctional non-homologous end joining protein LigD